MTGFTELPQKSEGGLAALSRNPPSGTGGTLAKPLAMPDYVLANVPVASYFFTVALLERRPRVLTENIEVLHEAFGSV